MSCNKCCSFTGCKCNTSQGDGIVDIIKMGQSSFTKRCKTHPNVFYSSDLSCYKCEDDARRRYDKDYVPETSARFNAGKTQVRELDPAFIMGLGEVLTAARQKYDEGNWMKPTKLSTPYESAMRHLMKFWSGDELDEETGKHHLLHAATNLMFLYYHSQNGTEGSDDRLFKKEKKK